MIISKKKVFDTIKNLTIAEASAKLLDLKEELSDRSEYEFDDGLNSLMIDFLEQKIELLTNMIDNSIVENGIIVSYTNF